MSVVGDVARSRSARSVPSRSSVNCGVRRSTGVPAASARLTAGRLTRSSRAVPRTSSEMPARRASSGRVAGSERMPSVQRSRAPARSSCAVPRGSLDSASKVSAIPVKPRANVSDRGASTRVTSAVSVSSRTSRVSGLASVRMTGARSPSSSGAASRVRLIAAPRPARPVPSSARLRSMFSRVGSSNVEKKSSSSGADDVALDAMTASSGNCPARAAAHELDVLQPERRARADPDARVGGDRRRGLVELERQLRRRRACRRVRRPARSSRPGRSGSRPRAPRCRRRAGRRWGCRPSARSSARTAGPGSRGMRARPRRRRRPPSGPRSEAAGSGRGGAPGRHHGPSR